ncbi:MAG: alpha-E domain-containing protein [Pseudomonadales bacterium]|jgi:uncharacterized alpha-E superfamily protein|nr:alpha-E domain-containing protein [Pseudomonadales bacterium]
MLARVVENMYWMSRYIERAEDMARLVNVNTHLHLDLPRGIAPGWKPLLTIIGAEEAYVEKYGDAEDEARMLRFLVADRENPQSILSSVAAARENARTFRDAVPREAWEEINALYHHARDNLQAGLSKRGRFEYLAQIIRRSQTLTGLLAGCMSQDEGYFFIQIGRQLERADMTTRILDVRTATLLSDQLPDQRSFENIQWMSVLKSLTGYQMYRLEMHVRIRRNDVLRFLLQSHRFPRAVMRCLDELARRLENLGDSDAALRIINRLQRTLTDLDVETLSQDGLHALVDELQIGLGDVHTAIATTYFLSGQMQRLENSA